MTPYPRLFRLYSTFTWLDCRSRKMKKLWPTCSTCAPPVAPALSRAPYVDHTAPAESAWPHRHVQLVGLKAHAWT